MNTYKAAILADSVSRAGIRLTTLEITYPRIVHAEFLTHRMFSRNAASSRAIPVEKLIADVEADPFVPARFGRNQSGMQAGAWLEGAEHEAAVAAWLRGRDRAVATARELLAAGSHKQLTNRPLEPYQWYTSIVTATEWGNFFALRDHPAAQPEIQALAVQMRAAMNASTPTMLEVGEWHLPLTPDLDRLLAEHGLEDAKRAAVGRCARVSYKTHRGARDPGADVDLCERLTEDGHMSPLEHVATPASNPEIFYGNLRGWVSVRKMTPYEADFGSRPGVAAPAG